MVIACDNLRDLAIQAQYLICSNSGIVIKILDLTAAGMNLSSKQRYDLPDRAYDLPRLIGIHQALGHQCYTIEFFDINQTVLLFRKCNWWDKPWKRYDSIRELLKSQAWSLYDYS